MRQYFDQKRTPARVGVLRYAASWLGSPRMKSSL